MEDHSRPHQHGGAGEYESLTARQRISRISSWRLKGGIKDAPASSVRAQASMLRATSKPRSRAAAPAVSIDFSRGAGKTMPGSSLFQRSAGLARYSGQLPLKRRLRELPPSSFKKSWK